MELMAERIRRRKEELHLTYSKIADMANCSRLSVQNWATGKTVPNSDMVPYICEALECTPNYLYGFSGVANG